MSRRSPRHTGRGWSRFATVLIVLALALALAERWGEPGSFSHRAADVAAPVQESDGARAIAEAFRNGQSDLIVEASGNVHSVLRDDRDGSRHQRIIVELRDGRTLLIAHNIDLAPRVQAIRRGDAITFKGEYEWNEKGGVVHWTHRDPDGRHPHGWIEHEGHRYD